MAYEMTAQEIAGLSEDQQVAIMESLVLAVTADRKTSPTETQKFDEAVNAVPWQLEPAKVMEQLLGARTRIVAHKSVSEAVSLIHQIAERLPDPAVREKLFHAMASIMSVGGELDADAKNMLGVFVQGFGLTGPQIDAIKADIKGKQTAS